ncbi:MAG: recombination protein RecR [Candidatus Wildermuthbacteria bacterium]|nr:recombination protein RecR [Candidatus Wildermuthbacteria bacterium]
MLKSSPAELNELIRAIADMKKQIALCAFCFNPFDRLDKLAADRAEDSRHAKLCKICRNPRRDQSLLCVVEKESDLEAIEKTRFYNGIYFILGGTVGMLRKQDISHLRVEELKERLSTPRRFGIEREFSEIIMGMNPTTEGEATALYLERMLKGKQWKLTRLGRGLPIGGEMEYADEETLRSSLESRR